jgi:hypothetical protein
MTLPRSRREYHAAYPYPTTTRSLPALPEINFLLFASSHAISSFLLTPRRPSWKFEPHCLLPPHTTPHTAPPPPPWRPTTATSAPPTMPSSSSRPVALASYLACSAASRKKSASRSSRALSLCGMSARLACAGGQTANRGAPVAFPVAFSHIEKWRASEEAAQSPQHLRSSAQAASRPTVQLAPSPRARVPTAIATSPTVS